MFAIELSHVSKQYKSQTYALKDLSLKVQEGDFFAFLGPNGAGKSTTIGIISSLVVKTAGQVKIGGYDLDENPTKAKKCLGLVPQEFNLNVFESCLAILINQAGYYGVSKNIAYERAEKYLNLLMLWNERNHQVRTLSGGMKRRLMIARALIHNPPILILDEPTAGVDVELRKLIWNFLENLNKDEKKTIVLTTHYLEEVERLCHHVAIINKGKLVSKGSLTELVNQLPGQSYILSLEEVMNPLTKEKLKTLLYEIKILEEKTIEVNLLKHLSLSDLFKDLAQVDLRVKSIREKENQIEQAFFHITKEGVGL